MSSRLVAETGRTLGSRSTNRLRATGKIPGVLYGLGVTPTPLAVDARELRAALRGDHGTNAVLTLDVDGNEHVAMARDIQRHVTRGTVSHVDFVVVDRNISVSADVPVTLVGDSDLGGSAMVDVVVSSLTINAKPESIPAAIEVDQSELAVGSQVLVKDLVLPEGVTTEVDPDEVVVRVLVSDATAELEAIDEEAAEGEAAPEDGAEAGPDGEGEGEGA
ncbi:MAG: LSU ribosomal protein L25p [uncultured Acidimicrobiales bacterium]|uniref:Large ribosomal subunit protein bL25 n=1 Tax=uncultured Acidimicrobiales bacterium TaxID=310071 RepID=A0A6J4IBG0_9ACTN|nr:MAG: LSU ribosomal protein L25p [uncultured Acidimicrobiales bacterium]